MMNMLLVMRSKRLLFVVGAVGCVDGTNVAVVDSEISSGMR